MGSSGGGGGGQSGKVEYAAYLQTAHGDWLDNSGVDSMTSSIVDLMETAHGSSPFSGETAFDPDSDITGYIADVDAFETFVLALDEDTDWVTYSAAVRSEIDTNIINTTSINSEISAYNALVDDEITDVALPRFQAGMRDINAVVSSAFVVGQSNIEAKAQKDKDKFAADLKVKTYVQRNEMIMAGTKDVIQLLMMKLEHYKAATHLSIEGRRLKFVMKNEEHKLQLEIDEHDTVWDMEVYQYGSNVLAAIAGAASTVRKPGQSVGQSALGGALSGAAMGASIGGAPGAIAGGILGLGASLL